MSIFSRGTSSNRGFIRDRISPLLSRFYARMGFANRGLLAQNLKGLDIQNHDLLLDLLVSKGILKGRFRSQVESLNKLEHFMLSGSVTNKQLDSIGDAIKKISSLENTGGKVMEALEEGIGAAVRAEAITQALESGAPFNVESLFAKTTLNVAGMLDRIFPTAGGVHSKMAQGVSSALGLHSFASLSGKYRLGFLGAISLGVIAIGASPMLLPAVGSFICTLGFKASLGLKIGGGLLAGVGLLARIGKRYVHTESDKWYVKGLARLGRSKFLDKVAFPLGMISLFTGFTFGTNVSNTFVLGKFLLEHGTLLGGLTAGIPASAILGSLIYYFVGTRRAIRANSQIPAPYGDEALRIKDIKKTHAYSGSAVVFSLTYFTYRWLATSIFVSAAFAPITMGTVALTMGAALGGYVAGYLLPNIASKYRSPWLGFLTGTAGAVALPMITGALTGDFASVKDSISAAVSLGVFAQDIHSTSHGAAFHQGQIRSLYPDRLVPAVSMGEKKELAGYFGRPEKPRTSFWEKAHVTPPDVVFSALTSAIYESNAYLYQCLLQCDMPNRGIGKGAKAVQQIVDIKDQSQAVCDELYRKCRAKLDAFRNEPDLQRNYQELIALLANLAKYFGFEVPKLIKKMRDDFDQDWKGIYDASIDIALKKGQEFAHWADELEIRRRNNDQLTREEVYNILLYFCDRFDVEFVLGVRKDSNEYVMRVQKNENQAGLREFIGNTAYEITRFNSRTGQASIERILATRIRRRNTEWEHEDDSKKYSWHHRESDHLKNDQQSVREYRERVESHSKDIAFVINDEKGIPLALQTRDGQILLIADSLDEPLSLKIADGTWVTVSQTADGFVGTRNGDVFYVDTIKNYNRHHDNKIYFVANYENPRSPFQIEALPEKMHEYYKDSQKRPLYTYAIDPHDYEFNLDSEFVNSRIASEYVPIFERDRANKYASVSYKYKRKISLDYDLSGLPWNDDGTPREPDNIQLNWSPMYMRVRTRDGQEYIVPYLEEKNGQIEPTVVVEKSAITDWKVILNKYARYYTFNKNVCKFKDGKFTALFKHEYLIADGINEITLTLPEAPFIAGGEKITPSSAEEFTTLLNEFLKNNPSQTVSIGHKRKYNWRRIKKTVVENGWRVYFVYDTENGTESPSSASVELSNHPELQTTLNRFNGQYPNKYSYNNTTQTLTIRGRMSQEEKNALEHLYAYVENQKKSIRELQESSQNLEIALHQSNSDVYSMHFPPIHEIESIETEVFRKSVGTLPYARYTYRFNSIEEAEKYGNSEVEKDERGHFLLDADKQPVMKKGCPIWIAYGREGEILGYEIERFGRPESIFELGSFDPTSVDRNSLKFKQTKKGLKLTLDAVEWSTKLYPVEPALMDLGTEDNPKVRIKGVITDPRELKAIFGSGSILWNRYTDPDGQERYARFSLGKKLKDVLSIIDVKFEKEERGKLVFKVTRKEKHGDVTFTDPAFAGMAYSAEWVEKVEFGGWSEQAGREIKITYKNPHTGQLLGVQTLHSTDKRLEMSDHFHEPTMELREIYDKEGNCKLTPYLKFTRVKVSRIKIGANLSSEQISALESGRLSIITPQSALRLQMEGGGEEYLPLNDKVDGEHYIFDENDSEATKFSHHLPRFEDGKVGLIIGPQLSISGRNWYGYTPSGIPYCALDQSIFMAPALSEGLNYGRQPYAYGVGGGNIQPDKSRAGDGRIREGTTVQNGTPVGRPLRKALASAEAWNEAESRVPFFSIAPMPATITEDYREGKGIYKKHGHAAVFHNKVVAIGAGVEDISQILTQRRRWPTSVPIGQYWFFRDLIDELVKSKIASIVPGAKPHPSHYTWDQLLHEWNGVTWYYCGMAEYVRSFAPLAYFMGFTAYPVDPIAFPAVWLGSFTTSMLSHTYSMKKVGNHPLESVYWGQAAYKSLVPNFVEMLLPQPGAPKTQGRRIFEELATCRLAKECLGQFGVTVLSGGGKLDERYLRQISDDIWLKAATFGRGILEMGNINKLFELQGGFSPDLFAQATTYFAVLMNTIWPYYDMLLNGGALKLAEYGPKGDPNFSDKTRFYLISQMIQGELDRKYHPIKRNKMQYTLGITDWPKEPKEQARYIQDLAAEECREVFCYMPDKAGPMLNTMLRRRFLVPAKVATILEAMFYDDSDIAAKTESFLKDKLKDRKGRSLETLLIEARTEANANALFAAGLAVKIFKDLHEENQEKVIESMREEKRRVLSAILDQN